MCAAFWRTHVLPLHRQATNNNPTPTYCLCINQHQNETLSATDNKESFFVVSLHFSVGRVS